MRRKFAVLFVATTLLGLAGWSAHRLYDASSSAPNQSIPTIPVKRGDVEFSVSAKGELQGGNSEMLVAPMAGGAGLSVTFLRESGDLVKKDEVVVKFDTTEQEFKLREAQADLAEAEQQVIQATAESAAKEEEARYELVKARSEFRLAEIEVRRNELLSRIAARQNEMGLAAALDKVKQLEKDYDDRVTAARAGVAMQEAARAKAKVAAETAQRNIESMTLRAKTTGYVAIQQNTQGNFNWGSYLPLIQVGDTIRAGMAVAQIPDLTNWEVTARIGEMDRGHLAAGQSVDVQVVALPRAKFHGKITNVGGTSGPPWNRAFECKIGIADPSQELRPGMSVRITINTDVLKSVLWLPSQALFESDGRKFVYLRKGNGFTRQDVSLVRRSESRVVIDGLSEGDLIALANPDQMRNSDAGRKGGALEAIQR